jgi:glutamate-ammonia-ligase adenylyltransferase
LVTEREASELVDAYLFLRRLEHRVQFASGQQTHALPRDVPALDRIARSLAYDGAAALARELTSVRTRVSARFSVLQPGALERDDASLEPLWSALDAQDEAAAAVAVTLLFDEDVPSDLPRHLLALARRPDGPLGATTRDRRFRRPARLVHALAAAAGAEQAGRLLVAFFARVSAPGTYIRALGDDPQLVRALCSLLGASAFLGEALVAHPDLADHVLFARGAPDPEAARAQVDEEVAALREVRAVDAFVGALRRAKRRVTFAVGLADLAGELAMREVSFVLTALADATARACVSLRDSREDRER